MPDHWSYEHFTTFIEKMLQGKEYFTCNLPYQLAVEHGLLTETRAKSITEDENLSEVDFLMEFEAQFYKQVDNALVKTTDILPTRVLSNVWTPPTPLEYSQEKDKNKKSWDIPQLSTEEIRILSADIAMMKSTKHANDNSIFTLIRGIPKNEEYIKQMLYMESCEGEKATALALRIKQLFYQGKCDYISLDCSGIGLSVYDSLTEYTYDKEADITYPPMTSFNDEKMTERCGYKDALPIIYTIKATAEMNHDIALTLKTAFQKKNIQLPITDIEARDYLIENKSFAKKDSQTQARLLLPYVQASALQNELVNLESYVYKGYLRVAEKSGKRKDRYSSLAYNLYLFKQLEKDLKRPERSGGGFISFW